MAISLGRTSGRPSNGLDAAKRERPISRRLSSSATPRGMPADALRAAGIEVWFDQSELRAGDASDAAIRKQIKAPGLFPPITYANALERAEGYFRLESKMMAGRSRLMAPVLGPSSVRHSVSCTRCWAALTGVPDRRGVPRRVRSARMAGTYFLRVRQGA